MLAHELGHFKRSHMPSAWRSRSSRACVFALLGFLARAVLVLYRARRDAITGRGQRRLALVLFMLVLPVFGFFVSPLAALLSRRHEFEADAYAARKRGADLVSALIKLYEDNASTLTPDPMYGASTTRTRRRASGWPRCR